MDEIRGQAKSPYSCHGLCRLRQLQGPRPVPTLTTVSLAPAETACTSGLSAGDPSLIVHQNLEPYYLGTHYIPPPTKYKCMGLLLVIVILLLVVTTSVTHTSTSIAVWGFCKD